VLCRQRGGGPEKGKELGSKKKVENHPSRRGARLSKKKREKEARKISAKKTGGDVERCKELKEEDVDGHPMDQTHRRRS